jgi:hypothetical protein
MEKVILGSLENEGFEVVLRGGRHYVRYDAGTHMVALREDEISESELGTFSKGGDFVTQALFSIQHRIKQAGGNPYEQNWAPKNV